MAGGGIYLLERAQTIQRPLGDVFRFFADAFNLEAITPPFLRFRIVTPPPIVMAAGTTIDYRLRLFGVPFGWRTRIERFEPESGFVDVQIRGPYRLWHHTHTFEPVGATTRMRDRVRYALPLGPLGRLAHAAVVRRTLDSIFDYRRDRVAELFA
jgi:ligand-binding SRPBCC domain-containing protein